MNSPDTLYLNSAAFLKGIHTVGPKLRDALWVQGCSIRCPGCANQNYLPAIPNTLIPVERLLKHFRSRVGKIDGCSVLGGEPTEQPEAVTALLKGVKQLGLSTVVFSGRMIEQLQNQPECRELLRHTDLLIDGPFLQSQTSPDLYWRGSLNQRFHLLSNTFNTDDLAPPSCNQEMVVGQHTILLHGVGWQLIPFLNTAIENGNKVTY